MYSDRRAVWNRFQGIATIELAGGEEAQFSAASVFGPVCVSQLLLQLFRCIKHPFVPASWQH